MEQEEVVDGLPVLADQSQIEAPRSVSPAEVVVKKSQVAALAVSTFAAGAATMALANRQKTRKVVAASRRKALPLDVLSSRSFLVDVHLLRRD